MVADCSKTEDICQRNKISKIFALGPKYITSTFTFIYKMHFWQQGDNTEMNENILYTSWGKEHCTSQSTFTSKNKTGSCTSAVEHSQPDNTRTNVHQWGVDRYSRGITLSPKNIVVFSNSLSFGENRNEMSKGAESSTIVIKSRCRNYSRKNDIFVIFIALIFAFWFLAVGFWFVFCAGVGKNDTRCN